MASSEETAERVESLYREHLEESFQGTLRFDPIRVELTRNQFDREAFHATVVYDGGHGLLDPAKLNRISSRMADRAAGLGIEDTILESYVHRLEYTGQREFVEDPLEQAGDNGKRWQELLNIAREPLGRRDPPTGTELNLAVDRCYFAAYHALCHSNAQALAGGSGNDAPATGPESTWAWTRGSSWNGSVSTGARDPARWGTSAPPSPSFRNTGTGPWNVRAQPSCHRRWPGSSGGRRAPLWRWRP